MKPEGADEAPPSRRKTNPILPGRKRLRRGGRSPPPMVASSPSSGVASRSPGDSPGLTVAVPEEVPPPLSVEPEVGERGSPPLGSLKHPADSGTGPKSRVEAEGGDREEGEVVEARPGDGTDVGCRVASGPSPGGSTVIATVRPSSLPRSDSPELPRPVILEVPRARANPDRTPGCPESPGPHSRGSTGGRTVEVSGSPLEAGGGGVALPVPGASLGSAASREPVPNLSLERGHPGGGIREHGNRPS